MRGTPGLARLNDPKPLLRLQLLLKAIGKMIASFVSTPVAANDRDRALCCAARLLRRLLGNTRAFTRNAVPPPLSATRLYGTAS